MAKARAPGISPRPSLYPYGRTGFCLHCPVSLAHSSFPSVLLFRLARRWVCCSSLFLFSLLALTVAVVLWFRAFFLSYTKTLCRLPPFTSLSCKPYFNSVTLVSFLWEKLLGGGLEFPSFFPGVRTFSGLTYPWFDQRPLGSGKNPFPRRGDLCLSSFMIIASFSHSTLQWFLEPERGINDHVLSKRHWRGGLEWVPHFLLCRSVSCATWENFLTALSLSVFINKMRINTVPAS